MRDGFVETNGIRLHYLDHGGEGPVLVMLPGLTANAHSFDGLVHAGLTEVARVLALDMRGRGESDAPASGYTIEDHAGDVLGLLDALGLDRVVIVGHSFGGLLAYWLAANHPDRVDRCVAIDAPAELDPAMIEQIKPSLDRLERIYPSWDDYLALVQSMPYFAEGGWDDDVEQYFRADVRVRPDGTVQARCRPEHIEEVIRGRVPCRLAGARRPHHAADPAPARSGELRTSGRRRLSSRGRRPTARLRRWPTAGSSTESATTSRSCSAPGRRS